MSYEEYPPEFVPGAIESGKPSFSKSSCEDYQCGGIALSTGLFKCGKSLLLNGMRNRHRRWRLFSYSCPSPIRRYSTRFVTAYPRFVSANGLI